MLNRRPLVVSAQSYGSSRFEPTASALLQVLPSGICLSLEMMHPATLGRTPEHGIHGEHSVDLTPYNANQHGVSRQHCLLRRREQYLVVTDLGSTNGTHVNGELLLPNHDYVLCDGDHLVLGTLHLIVYFSTTRAT